MHNKNYRRRAAWLLALCFLFALTPATGRATQASGVYFTAANDHLLDLSSDTMPFYSNGVLYVSSRLFEGNELGISYARSTSLGLATLYSSGSSQDLLFDLAGQIAYDKQGNLYSGYAIERGSVVFFPLNLVCRYFGLTWSYSETDLAPLIRVKNSNVVLGDRDFIDAAARLMGDRYSEYEKSLVSRPPSVTPDPPLPSEDDPPVQAAEGQKIYLVIDASSGEDAWDALEALGDTQATFLLGLEEMEDAELLRALVAGGHAVALRLDSPGGTEARAALLKGREAMWQAACCWLELAWYEDGEEAPPPLEELGFVRVSAGLRWTEALERADQAAALLRAVGRYREDLAVYIGSGAPCAGGLPAVVDGLEEGRYHISAWRLTMGENL